MRPDPAEVAVRAKGSRWSDASGETPDTGRTAPGSTTGTCRVTAPQHPEGNLFPFRPQGSSHHAKGSPALWALSGDPGPSVGWESAAVGLGQCLLACAGFRKCRQAPAPTTLSNGSNQTLRMTCRLHRRQRGVHCRKEVGIPSSSLQNGSPDSKAPPTDGAKWRWIGCYPGLPCSDRW